MNKEQVDSDPTVQAARKQAARANDNLFRQVAATMARDLPAGVREAAEALGVAYDTMLSRERKNKRVRRRQSEELLTHLSLIAYRLSGIQEAQEIQALVAACGVVENVDLSIRMRARISSRIAQLLAPAGG